jgi:hypothetical protein
MSDNRSEEVKEIIAATPLPWNALDICHKHDEITGSSPSVPISEYHDRILMMAASAAGQTMTAYIRTALTEKLDKVVSVMMAHPNQEVLRQSMVQSLQNRSRIRTKTEKSILEKQG